MNTVQGLRARYSRAAAGRSDAALAIFAICLVSFVTHLWLFYSYFGSRPRRPEPELGFLYKLNNHGSIVYVSKTETTGLALLMIAFAIAGLATLVVAPKQFAPHRGLKLSYPTSVRRQRAVLLCSLAFWLAVILFVGPRIVDFVVGRGIIL